MVDRANRRACGNWLGKQRRNFNLTNRCWDLLHELALEFGLDHGAMLEICVREKYIKDIGPLPKITYAGGEKAK
jgi:hypothetical protein